MRQVFVTGGSGFVGGAAISRFLADGWRVRAMSRSATSDEKIRGSRAEPVRCDLENVTADHIGDAGLVMHAGAFLEAWGPKDAWDRVNVGGTERMLAAAKAAGVSRFIHIGTEAALLHGQHLHNADETAPLALDSPIPYCRTKALAERAVCEADDSANGFTTIVLRPRFIWGPRRHHATTRDCGNGRARSLDVGQPRFRHDLHDAHLEPGRGNRARSRTRYGGRGLFRPRRRQPHTSRDHHGYGSQPRLDPPGSIHPSLAVRRDWCSVRVALASPLVEGCAAGDEADLHADVARLHAVRRQGTHAARLRSGRKR